MFRKQVKNPFSSLASSKHLLGSHLPYNLFRAGSLDNTAEVFLDHFKYHSNQQEQGGFTCRQSSSFSEKCFEKGLGSMTRTGLQTPNHHNTFCSLQVHTQPLSRCSRAFQYPRCITSTAAIQTSSLEVPLHYFPRAQQPEVNTGDEIILEKEKVCK